MRVFSLMGEQLASYDIPVPLTPFNRASLSGGPHHGKTLAIETWVQGWGDYTVSPPCYYRRDPNSPTRFIFQPGYLT